MSRARYNPLRRPVNSIAESFKGASGVTISGGVHAVVGGSKIVVDGDVDMEDIQRLKEAISQDPSTISKASLLSGAKTVLLQGANTESIGGGSIVINGQSKNPYDAELQDIQTAPEYGKPAKHVNSQNFTSHPAERRVHPQTYRSISATVGTNAKNLTVGRGGILSANAGSRIVGSNITDILAIMNKAKEAEALDTDRHAEILQDSRGVVLHGSVQAVAGFDIEIR